MKLSDIQVGDIVYTEDWRTEIVEDYPTDGINTATVEEARSFSDDIIKVEREGKAIYERE